MLREFKTRSPSRARSCFPKSSTTTKSGYYRIESYKALGRRKTTSSIGSAHSHRSHRLLAAWMNDIIINSVCTVNMNEVCNKNTIALALRVYRDDVTLYLR